MKVLLKSQKITRNSDKGVQTLELSAYIKMSLHEEERNISKVMKEKEN